MKEDFMSELRNKFISDKFKENFDESNISLAIYKLLGEKEKLHNQVEKLTGENNDLEERVIHQDNVIKKLKQPQIFIDTEDMEERYEEELYKEYLEKEKEHLQSVIDKAIEYINNCDFDNAEILNRCNGEPYYDSDFKDNLLQILRSKE